MHEAVVLSPTLAGSKKRLLRSLRLSSAALPPAAQTRFVSQSSKAGTPGNRPRPFADVSPPGQQASASRTRPYRL